MTRRFRYLATGVLALLASSVGTGEGARAGVIIASSFFDSGSEGWTTSGDAGPVSWVDTGGNPGGFIQATDLGKGTTWYFDAPQKFLDVAPTAYGGSLGFDLMQDRLNSGSRWFAPDVVLEGNGLTLIYQMTTPGNNHDPSTNDFTSYNVGLDVSAGWKLSTLGGQAASESQIRGVLGSLTALRIRGEYWNGRDIGSLDNVVMTAVPEPSTLVLAGLGLIPVGLGWIRSRKRGGVKAAG